MPGDTCTSEHLQPGFPLMEALAVCLLTLATVVRGENVIIGVEVVSNWNTPKLDTQMSSHEPEVADWVAPGVMQKLPALVPSCWSATTRSIRNYCPLGHTLWPSAWSP